MNKEEMNAVATTEQNTEVSTGMPNVPLGFEDEDEGDMLIPRIKIIQTLSPERKDKIADEGDIIDSLTKTKLNGKVFIPVFKFNNNILWKDRADGGGILCRAADGKVGVQTDGTQMPCQMCKKCEFDNTKQGREAVPKCTKYMNFFGFFAGERMPIILSFSKTNYGEGKKLFSLAKVTMQNMWNYGYALNEKLMSKGGNDWYNIIPTPAGPTSDEDRAFGIQLYKSFRTNIQNIAYDMDEGAGSDAAAPAGSSESSEF